MNLNKILFALLIFSATMVTAQVKIGENPNNIDAASIIELESTTKAFVLTRVTEIQMQSISPLYGAMVYNIDSQCIHYFDGSSWINLCQKSGLSGKGIQSTVDNNDGTFTLNYSDGTNFTTSNLTGPAGADGVDGVDGTQGPAGDPATDDQTLTTNNTPGDLSITGGNNIILNVDDADADAGNEIQDLQFSSGIISLTNDPDATIIDLSGFDTDSTDDFDGEWASLANRPAGLDDGDDDTQLTDAQVAVAATAEGFITGAHTIDTDTNLTETEVDAFVSNNGYSTGAHTIDTDTQLTNAEVAAAATAEGFVTGTHTVDTDTNLTETEVDAFVSNNGYSSGAHTVDTDTQLTNAEVAAAATAEGFVTGAHTIDTDTQLSKTDIETMGFVDGAHTIDTDTQLSNAEVAAAATAEGFVTDWRTYH